MISDIDRIDAFKDLEYSTKMNLFEIATIINIKKGNTLYWEKDRVDTIYGIIQGKISILRYSHDGKRKIIFILDKGNLINEDVFDNCPASAACEAFEDSTLITFKKELFKEVMKIDFNLTKNMMLSMGNKARRLYRQLKNTVAIRIDKKLAAKLWKLSRDFGVNIGQWKRIDLTISIRDLSQMMGSPRETISRNIKLLSGLALIKVEKKVIFVKEKKLSNYIKNS